MQWPLVLAGLAMGVAASPHCALMCSASCGAISRGCSRNGAAFQLGRTIGYMAGGAVAAGSVAALGVWSQAAPALRPLWLALHLALLALGIFWLATGRAPMWRTWVETPIHLAPSMKKPLRAGLLGLSWVAWPCGALHAALLLAALANSAWGGALVMGAFSLASMPALVAAPWAWSVWRRRTGASLMAMQSFQWRLAGLGLVAASGYALGHGLWDRIAAFCGF